LAQISGEALIEVEQHTQYRHGTVPGATQHTDHPKSTDLGRAIEPVAVAQIAGYLDQAIALPVPQHIRGDTSQLRHFTHVQGFCLDFLT
jgi:hypothetical protein